MGHVVTHDLVSYRDPDDPKTGLTRDQFHFLYSTRGEELPEGVSEGEIKRLLEQGAIVDSGSAEAELARRGLPGARSLSGGQTSAPLFGGTKGNEAAQIRSVQSVLGVGGGIDLTQSAQELARLSGEVLVTVAKALGVGDQVSETATKSDIIDLILTGGKGAAAQDEIAEQVAARDAAANAARETTDAATVPSPGPAPAEKRSSRSHRGSKAAGESSSDDE
jgi:hypothetical protein